MIAARFDCPVQAVDVGAWSRYRSPWITTDVASCQRVVVTGSVVEQPRLLIEVLPRIAQIDVDKVGPIGDGLIGSGLTKRLSIPTPHDILPQIGADARVPPQRVGVQIRYP